MSLTDYRAFVKEYKIPQNLIGSLAHRSQSEVSRWLSEQSVSDACREEIEIAIDQLEIVVMMAAKLPSYLRLELHKPEAIRQLLEDLEHPDFVSRFWEQAGGTEILSAVKEN
jgi:hypothetical protein